MYEYEQEMEEEIQELAEYMSEDEGDADLMQREMGDQMPRMRTDFASAVVVDNLPKVDSGKYDKLFGVVRKVFGQMGTIDEDGLEMPVEESSGLSAGFAFVNYTSAEEAGKAVLTLNNWALDKTHTLSVTPYSDLNKLSKVPEEYTVPNNPGFRPRVDPSAWLADPAHRDQFMIRYSNPNPAGQSTHETEVLWCEKGVPPTLCYGGEREKESGKSWCELYAIWSPQGTYLSTLHAPGLALWGGDDFTKQGRFSHAGVKIVDFSPCENYMVTCNFDQSERAIVVWDLLSGQEIRGFPMLILGDSGPSMFQWSHDGNYLARRGKDLISIYELPSMKLLDRKSLKAVGVRDFEWSPNGNVLAYWAPEQDNTPARVSVVEIPSRKEMRQKNLFHVSDCRLHWQAEGVFLCVKVLRHSKSKKTQYNNFELFRVKEELVPVEMMEMKDPVVAFAWEPQGDRFAIIHGERPSSMTVTFYTMNGGKGENELTELCALEDRPCNHLYWSPTGQYIVLAAMGDNAGANGYLEFFDTENKATFRQTEHFRCSYIEWDRSGRFVVTAVTQAVEGSNWKAQMDNGYRLYSFQGVDFFEFKKDNFYQILWRPRPASLLSGDEKRKIVKNLRKYERDFERLDRAEDRRKQRATLGKKIRMKKDFMRRLATMQARVAPHKAQIVAMRGGYDEEDDSHYIVESRTRQVVVSSNEEVVS